MMTENFGEFLKGLLGKIVYKSFGTENSRLFMDYFRQRGMSKKVCDVERNECSHAWDALRNTRYKL